VKKNFAATLTLYITLAFGANPQPLTET